MLLGAAVLLGSGCAQFAGTKSEGGARDIQAGTVSVTTSNPSGFTPTAATARESKAARAAWVEALCEHVAEQVAQALPDGERAEVHITDVRRTAPLATADAGGAQTVPPRIALSFKRISSKGKTMQTATRTLQDNALELKGERYVGDPLRYEKALVDAWVAKEFGVARL